MTAPVWTREGSGYEVEYVARVDDRIVARVYRGGDRYYPWSVTMPGHRVPNAETLTTAKQNVERKARGGSMNANEAAAALGATPHAIRKAIARGTMAATTRIGPRGRPEYVIEPEEVERYRLEHRMTRLIDRPLSEDRA